MPRRRVGCGHPPRRRTRKRPVHFVALPWGPPEAFGASYSDGGSSETEKRIKRRANIAKELVQTEENYVNNIRQFIEVHV
jgi:hypothetical protein